MFQLFLVSCKYLPLNCNGISITYSCVLLLVLDIHLLKYRCFPGYPHKCPKLRIMPEKNLSKEDADRLLSLLIDQVLHLAILLMIFFFPKRPQVLALTWEASLTLVGFRSFFWNKKPWGWHPLCFVLKKLGFETDSHWGMHIMWASVFELGRWYSSRRRLF